MFQVLLVCWEGTQNTTKILDTNNNEIMKVVVSKVEIWKRNYPNEKIIKIKINIWVLLDGLSLFNICEGIEVVSQLCLSDGRPIISHNEWWVNAVSWIVGHFSSPPSGCKDPHTSSSPSSSGYPP